MLKSIKYLSVCLLFLFSCGGGSVTIPLDENGNEDFIAFHKQFYADSLFQLQRIEFPMLGNNPDGSTDRFFWDLDNWQYKKPVDESNPDVEKVPFANLGGVMRERILVQKRFMIENLFTLIDNKWYMTYYSGIHDIGYYSKKNETPTSTTEETATDNVSIEQH